MSLVTQMIVAEKFGIRLTMEQLADAVNLSKHTIYNQVSKGTCAVNTYLDGGKRFADYREVARHLDECNACGAMYEGEDK